MNADGAWDCNHSRRAETKEAVHTPYASLFVNAGNNNSLAKGKNPLHQFPRSKSATSPQQIGSFPCGEVSGKRVQ